MILHCESDGVGPDVVLLHGWGWHGGVWDDVAHALADEYRVWVPDFPGHGRSREPVVDFSLSDLTAAVSACVPRNAAWIGWSLGALVALMAAQRGETRRLVLAGATPRFVQDTDWQCGQSRQWFNHFGDELARDRDGALERFTSLHVAAKGNERRLLRRLRAELARYRAPDADALHAGLRVLEQTDLRAMLPTIAVPTLVWHGAQDQIVVSEAGERLARALPHARFVSVADAGHASILSHANVFVTTVKEFLRE